jgi:hypothetical protein
MYNPGSLHEGLRKFMGGGDFGFMISALRFDFRTSEMQGAVTSDCHNIQRILFVDS